MIGVLNAHMFGTPAEIGEHVDWSTPDLFTPREAEEILGDVATYAEENPHMILFVSRCVCARHNDGSVTTSVCPEHADVDPCLTMSQITVRRRTGTIRRGTCTSCGWSS